MQANASTATVPYNQLTLGHEVGFINPRTATGLDPKSIGELSRSIDADGLNDALHVWTTEHEGKVYQVILRGQRRYRAIGLLIEQGTERGRQLAKATPIIAVAADTVLDVEVYAAREFAHTPGFSTYEIAAYMDHLKKDRGMSGKDVAQRLGKSETWVSRIMAAFKTAGPELKAAWAAAKVPDEAAKNMAAIEDPAKQAAAVAEFLEARASGNRKEVGEVRKKLAEISPKAAKELKGKDPKKGPGNRRVASDFDELLETLTAMQSKNPVLVGMQALAEWAVGKRTDAKLPAEFHAAVKKHEEEEAKRLRMGDKVSWESHANGNWSKKIGIVVEVVDPEAKPRKFKAKGETRLKRLHESYVVDVNGTTYWPVVSTIERMG
jgi:hypothetical protein